MRENNLKSPLYRVGNKEKQIKQLIKLFPNPKNYNNFYDLFGGSGVVGMNVDKPQDQKHYNELDKAFFNQVALIKRNKPAALLKAAMKIIDKHKLNANSKKNFMAFRNKLIVWEKANPQETTKRALFHFVINHFTFSNTVFTKGLNLTKGTTFGRRALNPVLVETKLQFFYASFPTHISNLDYQQVAIAPNSFIYLDPPYLGTDSNYQDKNSWNQTEEKRLLNYFTTLHNLGHKVAMSNNASQHLLDWALENNYHLFYIKHNQLLGVHHKKESANKTREILITNYQPPLEAAQLKLF